MVELVAGWLLMDRDSGSEDKQPQHKINAAGFSIALHKSG